MTATVVTGIGELVTCDGTGADRLGIRTDAAAGGRGRAGSPGSGSGPPRPPPTPQIDVAGRTVLPGFVDSHSHLVFAGDRAAEFAARMTGQPYDGGGIADHGRRHPRGRATTSCARLLAARIAELRRQGTTTVEIKSGYGLTVDDEAAAAADRRRGHRRRPRSSAPMSSRRSGGTTGPATSTWSPARCSRPPRRTPAGSTCSASRTPPHAFTGDEARAVLVAGRAAGLGLRVHGNQLGPGPGRPARGGARRGQRRPLHPPDAPPTSTRWPTPPTTPWPRCCPAVEFCTRSPYPDAGRLLEAGVSIALATDCNPGTCYSSSMPFVIALAVREMGLTPAEALYAATAGGARALRRDRHRPDRGRGPGRPGRAGRAVVPPPGLPARGAAHPPAGPRPMTTKPVTCHQARPESQSVTGFVRERRVSGPGRTGRRSPPAERGRGRRAWSSPG